MTYNLPAVKMVLDWMGPDRVIYGSDAPPLTSLKPRAIKLIKDLDCRPRNARRSFWGNAAQPAEAADAPSRPPPPEIIKLPLQSTCYICAGAG